MSSASVMTITSGIDYRRIPFAECVSIVLTQ